MEDAVIDGSMRINNDSKSIKSIDSSDSCLAHVCVEMDSTTSENDVNSKILRDKEDASRETLRNSKTEYEFEMSKNSATTIPDPIQGGEGEETETDDFDKEVEEDDLTSKLLLSIQVLPRIPKRKQQLDDSNCLSSLEKESYQSVLERVETATNRGLGSFHKWSTSGWKRSNEDNKVSEDRSTRSHKNGKMAKGKWSNRSKTDVRSSSSDGSRSKDSIDTLKSTKILSSRSCFNDARSECLDDRNKLVVEQNEVNFSKPGPLPTLPFDEQMRERAKLRSRQMGSRLESLDPESSHKNMLRSDVRSSDEKLTSSALIADTANINVDTEGHAKNAVPKLPIHLPESSSVKHSEKKITEKNSSFLKKHSNNSTAETMSGKSIQNVGDHRKRISKNDSIVDNAKSSDHQMLMSSKAERSPPLPHLSVLPLFASVCASVNPTSQSDEKALPVSKTVTFSCPEGSSKVSRKKGKMKKEHEKKHLKDKLNLQQRVIKEMKNYLRPYYVRRQISKEEYKDIMRRAVPRVCHDRQHEDNVNSSRIHKYASAYVDKVLMQQKRSAELSKKKSDIPPPPPSVQP